MLDFGWLDRDLVVWDDQNGTKRAALLRNGMVITTGGWKTIAKRLRHRRIVAAMAAIIAAGIELTESQTRWFWLKNKRDRFANRKAVGRVLVESARRADLDVAAFGRIFTEAVLRSKMARQRIKYALDRNRISVVKDRKTHKVLRTVLVPRQPKICLTGKYLPGQVLEIAGASIPA